MRWRSPAEIAFRLKQEARNLSLLFRQPSLPAEPVQRLPLPDPEAIAERLRDTPTAARITALGEQICDHRFPLLGLEIDTGPEIHWRRDNLSGKETGQVYFRRIPYLNIARAGDHKLIWELNRHQHLVLLAQASLLTNRTEFLHEIAQQLDSWFAANPFQRGINWSSALEVAFRALSWIWLLHLAGDRLEPALRHRLFEGLSRHGLYLEANLSIYFSPNTHVLGEAVALHALGQLFRGVVGAEKWEALGASVTVQQMERQVREDGSHFEQSTYYHVYALDMFLFHSILAEPDENYRAKLGRMAEYLESLLGPSRSLPFLGDDDGGRFFHPYGPRAQFGRATLATCGVLLDRPEWIVEAEDLYEQAVWWLGPHAIRKPGRSVASESCCFPDAGAAVMVSGSAQCIIDAGPFGPFRGGHSHADTLSIVARRGEQDLLIDPGTFTYVADPKWRNMFRGTAAHNTIRLQELDQADPAGSFGWRHPPQVALKQWHSDKQQDYLDAECRYRGFRHRRRVLFLKPRLLFILDDIEGQEIHAEQFWHLKGPVAMLTAACFRVAGAGMLVLALNGGTAELGEAGEFGWQSPAFGIKEPAPVIVSRRNGKGTLRFGAVLGFTAPKSPSELTVAGTDGGVQMLLKGAWKAAIVFPASGIPASVA